MGVTLDSTVRAVIASHPGTAEIFLQQGRLYRAEPGSLYASYDPPLTIGEYAAMNGLAPEPLLEAVRGAAETDEMRRDAPAGPPAPRELTPPEGAIGYTGTYQEPRADIPEVPFVWTLEAQGPE